MRIMNIKIFYKKLRSQHNLFKTLFHLSLFKHILLERVYIKFNFGKKTN